MISNSASNSIGKGSSNSSLSNPEPHSVISHNHANTETQSSLETSNESFNIFVNFGKKCYICDKSFLLRKKNLCKLCNNYVCNEHFSKIRGNDKVCDFCDRKEAKIEVRKEIEKELQILTQELAQCIETNNKLDRENCQKVTEIFRLEGEYERCLDYHEGKKQLLNARIANEKERAEKNDMNMENSRRVLEETEIAQEEMNKKYMVVQDEMEKVGFQLSEIRESNRALQVELQVQQSLKPSQVNIVELRRKLCEKCYKKFDFIN